VYRWFLSLRYLRARKTNLIGIGGIFVGVGALILILSIMTGFLEETRRSVRGSLSDILVMPRFGWDPTRPVPTEPSKLLAELRADPRVEAAAPHLVWYCMVAKEGENSGNFLHILSDSQRGNVGAVQLVGVDIPDEFAATEFKTALERVPMRGSKVDDPANPFAVPEKFDATPFEKGVVLGEKLYYNLGLRRGDRVTIVSFVEDPGRTDRFLTPSRTYVVVGTFRSKENEMDMERIYLERSELSSFLSLPVQFSEVLVKVKDFERDGEALRDDLGLRLAEQGLTTGLLDVDGRFVEVRTWQEFRGVLLGAIENERVLMAIMLSLVLLVAGFTVFAILSMMVTEKRRDIGILTALGATPRGVMTSFLMIAFWDALIGAVLGAFFGTWGALKIDAVERWLSATFGVQIFNRDVYLFDTIPSVVEVLPVTLIVLGAFLCAILFAALPAWRAAKLDPLEALRHE
jgi:lipoprotein-releasing system permease protein